MRSLFRTQWWQHTRYHALWDSNEVRYLQEALHMIEDFSAKDKFTDLRSMSLGTSWN